MNSNKGVLSWQRLWIGASTVLVLTLVYGWYVNSGDISYGRLEKIPAVEVKWYHAAAPLVLLFLTRYGVPVSTSFLVLSVFSSSLVLEKMFMKSFMGLTVAAITAFLLWIVLAAIIKRLPWDLKNLSPRAEAIARSMQAISTALLWMMWLTHDMANIAAFLPRQLPLWMLMVVILILVTGLGYVFRNNGGKIQHIVRSKTNTRFVISATIIDFVYAGILYYFKILNSIPMSTTWVFVGLLLGREVAIRSVLKTKEGRKILPMVISDLTKLTFGALVSVSMAFAVQGHLAKIDLFVTEITPVQWVWIAVGIVALAAVIRLMHWAHFVHHIEEDSIVGEPETERALP